MPSYDFAVIGAGVFGAWIAYRLQKAGYSVAILEAYGAGNSRSSSGGESRIIRMSYGPDELYTRWSLRSLELWKQFFEEADRRELFVPTGVLWTAPEGSSRAASNQDSLIQNGVPLETLTHSELERRFPQFRFSSPVTAILETASGVILARRAVQTVVAAAIARGADYFHELATPPPLPGPISAGQYIYACGPWLPKLFPALLGNRIHPTRQEVFFFGPPAGNVSFAPPAMPAWLDYGHPSGAYSLPDLERRGFKLAFDRHGPDTDPDLQERAISSKSVAAARAFVAERFPALATAPIVETRVCQYENTSNGDFLIDRHPEFDNVWIAGGGSGHGFKHGPAVGEYVERLVTGSIQPEPRFSLASKSTARDRAVY